MGSKGLNLTFVSFQVVVLDVEVVFVVVTMATQDQFIDKWTSILYTEATATPSGCLEVQKMRQNKNGYPELRVTIPGLGQKHLLVARLMYMCHHRVFNINGDISHLCHNRLCINIDHLVNESRTTNLKRQVCVHSGICTKNHQPHCLFL